MMEFLLHEPKTITNLSVDGGGSNEGVKPRKNSNNSHGAWSVVRCFGE